MAWKPLQWMYTACFHHSSTERSTWHKVSKRHWKAQTESTDISTFWWVCRTCDTNEINWAFCIHRFYASWGIWLQLWNMRRAYFWGKLLIIQMYIFITTLYLNKLVTLTIFIFTNNLPRYLKESIHEWGLISRIPFFTHYCRQVQFDPTSYRVRSSGQKECRFKCVKEI